MLSIFANKKTGISKNIPVNEGKYETRGKFNFYILPQI